MPNISKRERPGPRPRPARLPPQSWIPLLLAGFVLVTVDVLLDGPLRRADLPVYAWLGAHVHGPVWRCARVLAGIGQRRLAVIPLGAATLAAAWRQRSWRPLLLTLGVLGALDLAVDAMKDAVGRTGPGPVDRVRSGGEEYPSGHTVNGVVMWGVALRLLRDVGGPAAWLTRRRSWLLALVMGFGAGAGVLLVTWHWLTDVVAAWLLGPPALWLALRIYGEPREGAHVATEQRERVIARR
jgi:membrane-associated phospholipid phosphatase